MTKKRLRRRVRPAALGRQGKGDDGFVLLESLLAIALISVIMAAFTTFFVNAVASTAQQRANQIATQIANSTVDTIRVVPTSDLLKGRDPDSVKAQFTKAPSTVAPWLSDVTQQAVDKTAPAGSGKTAAVSTDPVIQTIGSIAYSVNTYLAYCAVPQGATTNATCTPDIAMTGFLRAVVAVTWTGTRCPNTQCTYVTSTVVSVVDDPLFNQNQSAPPAPAMTNPGNQTSAVGDTVNLIATVVAVPTYRVALTSGTLPAGLFLNTATGAITGTPSAVTPSTPLTFTFTDGFGRTGTTSFTWTVVPALTATSPGNQAGILGTAITTVQVSASGGVPGYIWSDPTGTLPPGLTVTTSSNQANITGTPTAVGVFPVTLTVTDSQNRTSTTSFTWTIDYPPFSATNPGAQTSTVGAAATVTLTTKGGSGSFTWTGGASLPAGLTLTPGGVVSGTPTAAGASTVTLIATDTKTSIQRAVTFSWTVYARPTVTSPGNQVTAMGASVSLQLTTTCPNAPCTYALVNGPATLAISSTGLVTGTISSAAQTFGAVTVNVTDSSGAVVSSAPFSWTVYSRPTVTAPANQSGTTGSVVSLPLTTTCPNGPCSYVLNNGPATLAISSAGVITGTITSGAQTFSAVTVTVTDKSGVVATSAPFSWIVYARPTVASPGNQTVTTGIYASLQLSTSCPNAPCTYALNNGPAALAISGSGLVTGTITSAAQTFNNVTVTVTDNSGVSVASAGFVVVVNAAPTVANPGTQNIAIGTADTLDVSTLVTGGTGPLTYSASNLPAWLTLNTSTGLISGTSPTTALVSNGITLTVRDLYGVTATSTAFSWIVGSPPSAPQAVAVVNGDTVVTATWTAPATNNGAPVTGYTATVSPGGASCTTTGTLTCAINGLTDGVHYLLTVTATNSLGTGAPSAAVMAIPYPAVMSGANGMTLWLDGADPTALLAGSDCSATVSTTSIGCWRDKSGKNENFSQATTANRPGISTWNGLTAANFADNSDVLNSVNALDTYQTVFVAANVTTAGVAPGIVDLFGQATQDYNVRVGSASRSGPNANDWSYSSTSSLNWLNGAPNVNANAPAAMITSDQSPVARIFSASVSNTFYGRGVVGQIGDVITFGRVLSTTERRAVEKYLSNKWGVPVT